MHQKAPCHSGRFPLKTKYAVNQLVTGIGGCLKKNERPGAFRLVERAIQVQSPNWNWIGNFFFPGDTIIRKGTWGSPQA